MAGTKFRQIQTPDRLVNMIQNNVANVIDPITSNPIIDGTLIQNVTLTNGITNMVPIQLGRPWIGWIITKLNANAVIYYSSSANLTPASTLPLLTSATCVCDIYIF